MLNNVIFMGTDNVKNVVNNIMGGTRGVCLVAVVDLDKKLDKTHKDMVGRLKKLVKFTDRPLISYKGSVEGKADVRFVPQPPKGFIYTQYPYFKQAIKSGIEYLTINYRLCDRGEYEETYFMDGVVTTKDVVEQYLKEEKYYAPKTQIAVGVVDEKEQTRVATYEVEKIVYIGTEKAKAIEMYELYKE